ncbi:MAG: patatin family protein [Lachnospiraceae bacterium]|nr:patatin family protein [Lachnospiraceae bacterium]
MKTGLVLEGGGMRGLFSMGVLDVWLEQGGIDFDGAVGVSAGAAFGCNFKSRQAGRGIRYNVKYAKDWRYKSFRSLLVSGDLFGAKFCYDTLPRELDVFDTEAFSANPMEFYAAVTDLETGRARYKLLHDGGESDMQWIRASASLPIVSRIVRIGQYKLLDGGIADSIPLHFMEGRGFERNVVILTQPEGYVKEKNSMLPLVKVALRKYPKAIEAMENRHVMYNRETAYVAKREAEGTAFVIRPDAPLAIKNLEREESELMRVYNHGREVGMRTLDQVREFLAKSRANTAEK